MQSRRDIRQPPAAAHLPEMHVSMKVNIVSDGPGGISFSQAVNTPASYNGLYDYSNTPIDQQQYAVNCPESSMITWPVDAQQKVDQSTDPVVQLPTDTSQENMPEPASNIVVAKEPVEIEQKKQRHHKHKHHRKKDDDQSLYRSQSATSVATSTKASDVSADKKRGRTKHKVAVAPEEAAEESASSRKSNGRSSSTHGPLYRRRRQERGQAAVVVPKVEPPSVPSTSASATSSKASKPVPQISDRKLDELLSEVVINTFEDEDTKSGDQNRSGFYKRTGAPLLQDQSTDSSRVGERSVEGSKSGIGGKSMDEKRFRSPTGLRPTDITSDRLRYPVPVDTPTVPTANQAVQVNEPFQTERAMQTEKEEAKPERRKKREKKIKVTSELEQPVTDYLRHITEATSALIEASKMVLEQRAFSPQPVSTGRQEAMHQAAMAGKEEPAYQPVSAGRAHQANLVGRHQPERHDLAGRHEPEYETYLAGRNEPARQGNLSGTFEPEHHANLAGTRDAEYQANLARGHELMPQANLAGRYEPENQANLARGHERMPQANLAGRYEPEDQANLAGRRERAYQPVSTKRQEPAAQQQQIRTPKETLIDDPAIPPLSDDSYASTKGRITPGTPNQLNISKTSSGGSGGDVAHHDHHQHYHSPEDQPAGVPGIYYMHTYCAICGSPRTTRKAISGSGPVSPVVEQAPGTIPSQTVDNRDHFLADTRPSGGDGILSQTPPSTEAVVAPLPLPPPAPPPAPPLPPSLARQNVYNIEKASVIFEKEEDGYESFTRETDAFHSLYEEGFQETRLPNRTSQQTRIRKETLAQEKLDAQKEKRKSPVEYKAGMETTSGRPGSAIYEHVYEDAGPRMTNTNKEPPMDHTNIEYDITAEAKARLRELLGSNVPESANEIRSERIGKQEERSASAVDKSAGIQTYESPKIPNGNVVMYDRPSSLSLVTDLKEVLEQRRQQIAKQRETFFGYQRFEDDDSRAAYERNAVYVPAKLAEQPQLDVRFDHSSSLNDEKDTEFKKFENTSQKAPKVVRFGQTEIDETVESDISAQENFESIDQTQSPPSSQSKERYTEELHQSISDRSLDRSYDQQSYAECVTQKRLMPSAKIFELHMKPASSKPAYGGPNYPPRSDSNFAPRDSSAESSDEGSVSKVALAGSGTRSTIDDGMSTPSSVTKSTPKERAADFGNPSIDKSEVTDDQSRPALYAGDTLTSTSSGGSSKKANDLYRKALLSQYQQQQERKDTSSRASSINSERSSISNVVGPRGAGAFTVAEVDRYLEDNLSDYAPDRLTPLMEDWPGSRASEGTHSHDSLASETSYRADTSHDLYASYVEARPVQSIRQQKQTAEKNFADILRERNSARNVRLLYSSLSQQPPLLDRIDEHDQDVEAGLSRRRPSSAGTSEDENTLTGTSSIDREGSGVYAIKPSINKIRNTLKKSPVLAAMLGKGDAGSSVIDSELENIDDYSQGRISPMIEIGNDRFATISSYGEPQKDTIRAAQLISMEQREATFVAYGKASERVVPSAAKETHTSSSNEPQQNQPSSSEWSGQRKRLRQTDL